METIKVSTVCDGFYGGMLNPIGKMPKTTLKRNFAMVLLEKSNGFNGI